LSRDRFSSITTMIWSIWGRIFPTAHLPSLDRPCPEDSRVTVTNCARLDRMEAARPPSGSSSASTLWKTPGRSSRRASRREAKFSIKLDKLISEGQLSGFWIDPRDGKQKPIGTLPATGAPTFSTPEGWEDALLVLE